MLFVRQYPDLKCLYEIFGVRPSNINIKKKSRGNRCAIVRFNISDPCATSPCENGGVCKRKTVKPKYPMGFKCKCPYGFQGERCETGKLKICYL